MTAFPGVKGTPVVIKVSTHCAHPSRKFELDLMTPDIYGMRHFLLSGARQGTARATLLSILFPQICIVNELCSFRLLSIMETPFSKCLSYALISLLGTIYFSVLSQPEIQQVFVSAERIGFGLSSPSKKYASLSLSISTFSSCSTSKWFFHIVPSCLTLSLFLNTLSQT